ncbi:MAG: F0F1 ATP synthase subunit delta [Candidatus Omnitrophica bacterium]|nr:F0F1 ATP synthase subunit delta [Candidatus Omnitrophota bacterium]
MILQLVLIQIATFVLIILFMRWLLYSHISRALRRLQQLNQENLEKEKALKEEFERAKREAEREIEAGRQEAEVIKEQARENAEKTREDMVSKARKEAKRLINDALRDCQRKKTELTVEMQEKAVYLASDMIKYIFTERGREDLHSHVIDELIAEIDKLEEQKIKATGDKAELTCAYKLNDEQSKKLKEVLTAKLHKDIELDEKIDKDIIAGLNIKLGGFVIDGSIRNRFKKILPLMKEKAKQ